MTCNMKERRMKPNTGKSIAREVQSDLARAQKSIGVPADQRQRVPEKAIRGVLKAIEENDEALRFLATC